MSVEKKTTLKWIMWQDNWLKAATREKTREALKSFFLNLAFIWIALQFCGGSDSGAQCYVQEVISNCWAFDSSLSLCKKLDVDAISQHYVDAIKSVKNSDSKGDIKTKIKLLA